MTVDDTNEFLSMLYHALRARRRRRAIRLLYRADSSVVSVRFLAEEIAAAEHEMPSKQATGEPYRNAYNALSQTHLPTLSRASIVIYDSERQTVSPGPNLPLAALLIAISGPAIETLRGEESDDGNDPL